MHSVEVVTHYFTLEDAALSGTYLNQSGQETKTNYYWYITSYLSPKVFRNLELFMFYNNLVSNIVFYDADLNIIGSASVSGNINGDKGSLKVEYPQDTSYFRLCWGNATGGIAIWEQYYVYEKQ